MKTVKVIECEGTVRRDPTSYGYQFFVNLDAENPDIAEIEDMKVTVRIEVELHDSEVPKGP